MTRPWDKVEPGLQDVLRLAWKFRGFVVSDANSVRDLVTHGFASDASDAAFRAF